jgi:hypothetical protein
MVVLELHIEPDPPERPRATRYVPDPLPTVRNTMRILTREEQQELIAAAAASQSSLPDVSGQMGEAYAGVRRECAAVRAALRSDISDTELTAAVERLSANITAAVSATTQEFGAHDERATLAAASVTPLLYRALALARLGQIDHALMDVQAVLSRSVRVMSVITPYARALETAGTVTSKGWGSQGAYQCPRAAPATQAAGRRRVQPAIARTLPHWLTISG